MIRGGSVIAGKLGSIVGANASVLSDGRARKDSPLQNQHHREGAPLERGTARAAASGRPNQLQTLVVRAFGGEVVVGFCNRARLHVGRRDQPQERK